MGSECDARLVSRAGADLTAHANADAALTMRAIPPAARIMRTVLISELPIYDEDEMEIVYVALAETSASKIWFTHADIRRYFGVSRAMVARKLKAGLVPGIRFEGDRALEGGAVRRFSRTQVRFVLLAVRRRYWRTSVS